MEGGPKLVCSMIVDYTMGPKLIDYLRTHFIFNSFFERTDIVLKY